MSTKPIDRIFPLICARIRADLSASAGECHSTKWENLMETVGCGEPPFPTLEDEVLQLILVEIKKFPRHIQEALWWGTEQGDTLAISSIVDYESEVGLEVDSLFKDARAGREVAEQRTVNWAEKNKRETKEYEEAIHYMVSDLARHVFGLLWCMADRERLAWEDKNEAARRARLNRPT